MFSISLVTEASVVFFFVIFRFSAGLCPQIASTILLPLSHISQLKCRCTLKTSLHSAGLIFLEIENKGSIIDYYLCDRYGSVKLSVGSFVNPHVLSDRYRLVRWHHVNVNSDSGDTRVTNRLNLFCILSGCIDALNFEMHLHWLSSWKLPKIHSLSRMK